MDLSVELRPGDLSVVHLTATDDDSLTAVEDAFELGRNAGADAPIWLHGSTPERARILSRAGYVSNRTLLQMRTALPTPGEAVPTRAFTEADIDAVVQVNNRAFDWHPEQAGKDRSWLLDSMQEDWFEPDGFRLHEIDDRLAGFCWTKVHRQPQRIGEIYVIALDPDFTGRGLGAPLTRAGLAWLASRGLTIAMLYVESDNDAAVAIYERLGFETYRSDTLWRRTDTMAVT